MARRGLTLLELLIVLALLVALGAIALPMLVVRLDARAFETAGEVAVNHLLLARAHAQATGEPVEVRYRGDGRWLEARLFLAGREVIEEGTYRQSRRDAVTGAGAPGGALEMDYEGEDEEEGAIGAGWARVALPAGVTMSAQPPEEAETGAMFGGTIEEGPSFDAAEVEWPVTEIVEAADERSLRVAVYLPDGSAMLCTDVWLRDDGGRAGKLTVNPFTGLPRFERLEDLASAPAPEEEEEEKEQAEEETVESAAEPEAATSDEPVPASEPGEPGGATEQPDTGEGEAEEDAREEER